MDVKGSGLTEAEAERLALLVGECAAVIHSAGKVLQHGWKSHNPTVTNSLTNQGSLEQKLGNLRLVVQMMIDAGDLIDAAISLSMIRKASDIDKWLHHQNLD